MHRVLYAIIILITITVLLTINYGYGQSVNQGNDVSTKTESSIVNAKNTAQTVYFNLKIKNESSDYLYILTAKSMLDTSLVGFKNGYANSLDQYVWYSFEDDVKEDIINYTLLQVNVNTQSRKILGAWRWYPNKNLIMRLDEINLNE